MRAFDFVFWMVRKRERERVFFKCFQMTCRVLMEERGERERERENEPFPRDIALEVPYIAALIAFCISELLDRSSVGTMLEFPPVNVLSRLANSLDISESIAVATALSCASFERAIGGKSFFVFYKDTGENVNGCVLYNTVEKIFFLFLFCVRDKKKNTNIGNIYIFT